MDLLMDNHRFLNVESQMGSCYPDTIYLQNDNPLFFPIVVWCVLWIMPLMKPRLFAWLAHWGNGWSFAALLLFLFGLNAGMAANGQDFSKWEEAISKFEAADKEQEPASNGVLFLGSSSIRMWKTVAEDFPKHQVINRGFGGSTLPDCIHFFDRLVLPYKPSTIVFYEGDNDIGRGDTARTVYEHFKTFAAMVKEQLPGTRLIFIAIKPSIKRWDQAPEMKKANRMIQHYVWLNNDLGFADIWDSMLGEDGKPRPELFLEDGLHMTPKGYEIWTRIVAAEL